MSTSSSCDVSSSNSPIDSDDGGVASLPRAMWEGYRRYHACAYNLTKNGARVDDALKQRLCERLVREQATCFWLAALLACQGGAVRRFERIYSDATVDPAGGVAMTQAIPVCRMLGIALYTLNLDTHKVEATVRHPRNQQFQPGVMQALLDDYGEWRPHFLPVSRVKEDPLRMQRSEIRTIERSLRITLLTPESSESSWVRVSPPPSEDPVSNLFTLLEVEGSVDDSDESWLTGEFPVATVSTASRRRRDSRERRVNEARQRPRGLAEQPAEAADALPPPLPPPTLPSETFSTIVSEPHSVSTEGYLPPVGFLGDDAAPVYPNWCSVVFGVESPPVVSRGPLGLYATWFEGDTSESAPMCFSQSTFSKWAFNLQTKLLPLFYPKMVELRKTILYKTPIRVGDYVYVRDRPPSTTNPRYELMGGAIPLSSVHLLECGAKTFGLTMHQSFEFQGRRYYTARVYSVKAKRGLLRSAFNHSLRAVSEKVFEHLLLPIDSWLRASGLSFILNPMYSFIRKTVVNINWFRNLYLGVGDRVQQITTKEFGVSYPRLQDLGALPDAAAKVRAAYVLIKPYVPEHIVGPLIDARSNHLALDEPESIEPAAVAQALIGADDNLRRGVMHVKCFSHPPIKNFRCCVSCGCSPPTTSYRWKHRICNSCRRMLKTLGYTTYSGSQLQDNLQVPTCYPGIVYFRGAQYPPSASKWEGVQLYHGDCPHAPGVKIAQGFVNRKTGFGEQCTGWRQAEKRDLEKIKDVVPSTPLFALAGIACSGAMPMVSAQTDYNRFKALCGRVFRQQKPALWGAGPKPGHWKEAERFLPVLLPDLDAEEMSFEDWLASMPSHRKQALARAHALFIRRGLRSSDENFKAFVKTELLPGFKQQMQMHYIDNNGRSRSYMVRDLDRLDEMLDRLINGPADITHTIAGPILKPKMKRLKHHWGPKSKIIYGGCGPDVLSALLARLQDGQGEYIWCDFSMFDNTHSADSWAFLEKMYGEHGVDFARVLDMWRAPKGRIGPFKYQAKIMNASGRDDTALANAVLNGIATYLSICCAILKVELQELTPQAVELVSSRIVLSVCGDDSIGKVSALTDVNDFRQRFNRHIREFGFEAKLETSPDLNRAVYLGMRPYPTRSGWFWGKTIGRATYKMGFVMKPETRDLMAHITGVADMHCLCSLHVPILADLAKKIKELRQGAKRTPVVPNPHKPWEWVNQGLVPYDDLTIAAVAETYTALSGSVVTSDDVLDLIRCIASVTRLPCVVDHWLWKLIICSDDL